jgi:hypothetical protein
MAKLSKIVCPTLSRALVITNDARLAAQVSCVLARAGAYLPVIDGPRLTRSDHDAEVIRRTNAAARVKPNVIVFAGLPADASDALAYLPSKQIQRVLTSSDVDRLPRDGTPLNVPPLMWGRDRIGIGLLKALGLRSNIVFADSPSPIEHVPSKSGHLVVCEDGDDLSQVIAANYAFGLRAGLCIIPEVTGPESAQILENFYNLYEEQRISPTEALEALKGKLRELCGSLPISPCGSITFITGRLPYGFAFSDVPTTHLFKYPDLGISVINGLAAEQPDTPGVGVAVLVDPEAIHAPEIAAAERLLPPRGAFVRCYTGRAASVRAVAQMIELFPYDLLIIATHCGDSSGSRWTYEFMDSEGINREVVVDIAIGVGQTNRDDLLNVTQFLRFVSLDGVGWYDPDKSAKLYVGTAITDFIARTGSRGNLKPIKKETISRVVGSFALKLFDHNFIMVPRSIGDEGTPILINNACCSWHRLAATFTFCNARAYIGTLFNVSTTEAHDVAVKLLDKHFGKPLPAALWLAQREVYGHSVRRPYVFTGVYPQRLRISRRDLRRYIAQRLSKALAAWQAHLRQADPSNDKQLTMLKDRVDFYERELASFRARFK